MPLVSPYDIRSPPPFSRLALATPNSQWAIKSREGFIIKLTNDNVGIGESTPLPGWTESIKRCQTQLEAAQQIYESDGLKNTLSFLADTPAARHGVSLAAADSSARKRNRPLYQELGQSQSITKLDVNKTISGADREKILSDVESAIDEGFRTIKIKIGLHDPATDIETLRIVRTRIPSRINLRADINGNWTYQDVTNHISDLQRINLEYLEQPFSPKDLSSHRKLREESIPIALDESLKTVPISRILSQKATDYFIIKPMSIGGINKSRRIAMTGIKNDILPIITTTFDSAIARTGAVHLTASLPERCPAGLATGEAIKSDLTTDPAPVNDGRIAVPQSPGIGISPGFDW